MHKHAGACVSSAGQLMTFVISVSRQEDMLHFLAPLLLLNLLAHVPPLSLS